RSRAPAQLRADRAALLLRAEERIRGLPAAGRARILPPLEREARAAFGVHPVRLDAGEPHPAALGDGGIDLDVRGARPPPGEVDHAAALPRDLGGAQHPAPA